MKVKPSSPLPFLLLIWAMTFFYCSAGSKSGAPFTPPEHINLTPFARHHIVALPNGDCGLRPLFAKTKSAPVVGEPTAQDSFRGVEFIVATPSGNPAALLTVLPSLGDLQTTRDTPSPLDLESASPGYYKVRQISNGVFTELTATQRSGLFTFRCPNGWANVFIKPHSATEAYLRLTNPLEMEGYATIMEDGEPRPYFFAIRFQQAAMGGGLLKDGAPLPESVSEVQGSDIGGHFGFRVLDGSEVLLYIAASPTSIDDAFDVLMGEQLNWSFAWIRYKARESWQGALNQIRVWGDDADRQTFYASMARSLANAALFKPRDQSTPDAILPLLKAQYQQSLETGEGIPPVTGIEKGLNNGRQVREAIDRNLLAATSPAWLALGMIGLAPSGDDYLLLPPLFERIEIDGSTPESEPLIITVSHPSRAAAQVASAGWNRKKLAAPVLNQDQVEKGGVLEITAVK